MIYDNVYITFCQYQYCNLSTRLTHDGMGIRILTMERPSEERMGRVVRSIGEVSMITDVARDLCGGDEAKMEELIHRILFEMHDRTWGVSLHEGDPDLPLVEAKMVCEYLRLAVESRGANDLLKLTKRAIILAVSRPHQISLYRSMIYELGSANDVKAFEKALALVGERLLPQDSEDVRIYQRVVGKSYWELDLDMLRRVFVSNFMAWKVGMVKFRELEEEEVIQPEFLAEVSVFLTGVRVELRRIARVVVAKKVFPERKMGFFREEMDEDDDSINLGIDLETVRSFLD